MERRDGKVEARANGTPTSVGAATSWLFVSPNALPDRWRDRAVPLFLVPLLPGESTDLLEGQNLDRLSLDDEIALRLLATGADAQRIAKELHVTVRTVYRKLARLRGTFGVETTTELAAALAARGF